MNRGGAIEIQAGGLQGGDELSIDGGQTFRRVARVARHRGRVTVYFTTPNARAVSFNEDEIVKTKE
jgi:hypothetical protein